MVLFLTPSFCCAGKLLTVFPPHAVDQLHGAIDQDLATFGAQGEGPGEFSRPRLTGALPGDTLVVVDSRLRRINLFHPEEGFIRSATADAEIPGFLLTEGMFSSGSILILRMVFEGSRGDGFARRPVRYRSVALDGTLERDFGEFVGDEVVLATQTEGNAAISIMGNAPFAKGASVAVSAHRFFYGSQDTYEIQVYGQSGVLERIIRMEKVPLRVTDDQVAALIEEELAELEDNDLARQYRRLYMDSPIPEFHPAYGSIYADKLGYLWVQETRATEDAPHIYSIFDPEGRLAGSLALPGGLLILEIGEDYLLGRQTDEMGVQYLHLYDLTRPD